MNNHCKNCGRPIKISIFKGGDWCSENCRKALERRELREQARQKCTYDDPWLIALCTVHGARSKYPEYRGEHRPCLAVEPW